MSGHWAVSVERNGENIVTIESNCLSGRMLSQQDEDTIRMVARQLLAFLGEGPNVQWSAAPALSPARETPTTTEGT